MRADIRKLREIVDNYINEHKLTRAEFVVLAGGGLSVFQLGYLITGKATSMDLPAFAAYARGLGMPLDRLAALVGVMGAPNDEDDRRLAQAVVDLQTVGASLSGVSRDIFLDKIEQIVEQGKKVAR